MQILKKFSFKFFLGSLTALILCFIVGVISGEHITNLDGSIEILGEIFLILTVSSFLGIFVKPEVFKSWTKYLLWWIIPLIIAYSISSQRGGGFAGMNPFQPLFFVMLGVFTLSTPIYLYFKSKKLK